MSASRFSIINNINGEFNTGDEPMDTPDGHNSSSNDTLVVTAGVRLKHSPNTGSFVTAVINGHDQPQYDKATVIRPASNGQKGQEVITYNDLDQGIRENGQIGHVSFSNEEAQVKNGWFTTKQGNSNHSKTVTFPIPNPAVHIAVRNLENCVDRCEFDMSRTDTVDKLRDRLQEKSGWDTKGKHLIYGGKNMECGKTLQDYEFKEKSEILLSCRNRGG